MSAEHEILERWGQLHRSQSARTELDPRVRQSWERCIIRNISPESTPPKVPREAMTQHKMEAKKLYVYTNSILNPMFVRSPYPSLGGLLFNRSGVLLRLYGPKGFRQWAEKMGIRAGTKWTEADTGANIFSLGLDQKRGMKLEGPHNYAKFLAGGAYYFSPIALPSGETFGGLALAVPYEDRGDYVQTFALMAARIIELQFFWFNIVEVFGDSSDGHGVISLDQSNGKNHVLTMSKEVFKMLGISPRAYYYEQLETMIDPLPANAEFWTVLENKVRVMDKKFEITVGGKPHTISVSSSRYKEDKFHMNGLVLSVNSIQRINRLVSKFSGSEARYSFRDIIGQSAVQAETVKRSQIAARTDSNVLLLGESGVGKDIMAQAIHNGSRRSDGPFVAINCAAFSKELVASELFGYESGAFTGAQKGGSIGKFELAQGGTLFLDEIGDMPLDLQALMLRVIEQRSFMKVGGNTTIHVNVRIIAATNINLAERIRQGLFREDLFYRLGIVRIQVPPLRERGDDVLLLAEYFIKQICARLDKPHVVLGDDAREFLRSYSWPGNVRELQNLLEGIISTHDETQIRAQAIRQYLGGTDQERIFAREPVSQEPYSHDERTELIAALKACRNNRTKTAEYLGISRRTLYRRLSQYGLL